MVHAGTVELTDVEFVDVAHTLGHLLGGTQQGTLHRQGQWARKKAQKEWCQDTKSHQTSDPNQAW
jgi:hypothetical protein